MLRRRQSRSAATGADEDVGAVTANSGGASGGDWVRRGGLALAASPLLQTYIDLCDSFRSRPCPAVCIALRYPAAVAHVALDASFGPGDLLPLGEVLKLDRAIKSLDFHRAGGGGLGSIGCYVLCDVLQSANSLRVLNLSSCNIGEHGAVALAKGLATNSSVERLLLRGNHIGVAGAAALGQCLLTNRSLRFLDVSNNNLRARGVMEIESCAAAAEGRVVMRTDGNFVREELVGSVLHGIGLLVSGWGSYRLLGMASGAGDPVLYWSCAVYVVSVLLLYASSMLAHSFFLLRNVTEFFHVVDRAAIYVLIAGTYTPFMLVNLQHRLLGRVILVFVWVLAVVGVALVIGGGSSGSRRYRKLEQTLYLLMGWSIAPVIHWAMDCISVYGVMLLGFGGVIYSTGVFFYSSERSILIAHGLWHVFVLIASGMHFFAIFFFCRLEPSCEPDASAVRPWPLFA